jgi:hypothetical protein
MAAVAKSCTGVSCLSELSTLLQETSQHPELPVLRQALPHKTASGSPAAFHAMNSVVTETVPVADITHVVWKENFNCLSQLRVFSERSGN